MQSGASNAQTETGETTVWAVWPPNTKRESRYTLDAVVAIRQGKYYAPVKSGFISDEEATADWKSFENKYYRAGATYPLFYGGQRIGTVVVVGAADQGCSGPVAAVNVHASVRLAPHTFSLASTSVGFHGHPSTQRSLSNEEKQILLRLAAREYTRAGLNPALMKKIRFDYGFATDLDRDGRRELIGTTWLRAPAAAHQLFLIAQRHGEGYQLDLVQPYVQRDVVDGTDAQYEHFVEQLDLDGDGKDEVVTVVWFYESNEYRIYARQPEQEGWYELYRGGGGGC